MSEGEAWSIVAPLDPLCSQPTYADVLRAVPGAELRKVLPVSLAHGNVEYHVGYMVAVDVHPPTASGRPQPPESLPPILFGLWRCGRKEQWRPTDRRELILALDDALDGPVLERLVRSSFDDVAQLSQKELSARREAREREAALAQSRAEEKARLDRSIADLTLERSVAEFRALIAREADQFDTASDPMRNPTGHSELRMRYARRWFEANSSVLKSFCRLSRYITSDRGRGGIPIPVDAIWRIACIADDLSEGVLPVPARDACRRKANAPAAERRAIGHGLYYLEELTYRGESLQNAATTVASLFGVAGGTVKRWWSDRQRFWRDLAPRDDREGAARAAGTEYQSYRAAAQQAVSARSRRRAERRKARERAKERR